MPHFDEISDFEFNHPEKFPIPKGRNPRRVLLNQVLLIQTFQEMEKANSQAFVEVEEDPIEIEMMDERRIVKTDRKNTSYYPKPKTFKQKYR